MPWHGKARALGRSRRWHKVGGQSEWVDVGVGVTENGGGVWWWSNDFVWCPFYLPAACQPAGRLMR